MSWVFRNARESFDQHREQRQNQKSCGNHVLLDSEFVGALVRYFASDQTLLGISDDNRKPAMALVDRLRPGLWQTFQPAQGPLGLILFSSRSDTQNQIARLMRSLPGYCVGFSVTQQDPDFTVFTNLNSSRTVENSDHAATSRIVLTGTFGEFWKQTGRYFVDDLRRQTRRLEEKGIRMDFVAERGAGRVAECIRDYAKLEESGWKARGNGRNRGGLPGCVLHRRIGEVLQQG